MDRKQKLYSLVAVLGIVCLGIIGVLRFEETKEQIKEKQQTILEIKTDDVIRLEWEYNGEKFAFTKEDKWYYDDDNSFPVDEKEINTLLGLFESFGTAFEISDVSDFSQYGLDDSDCIITITTDSQTYTITTGDYSTMDSQRYVSTDDGNVYLANSDPQDYFDIDLDGLLADDEIPSFDKVDSIVFTGSEEYEIIYTEDSANTYCKDDVYFTTLNGKTVPLDTENIDSFISAIENLNLVNDVTYNADSDQLEYYGLNNPQLKIEIEYHYQDSDKNDVYDSFILSVNAFENENEDDAFQGYIRIGESTIIYKITEDEYNDLMAVSYNDLRHKDLMTADFSDVTKIGVIYDNTSYMFEYGENDDDERILLFDEKEFDTYNIQTAIKALSATEFTSEKPTGKEEITFMIYLDGESPRITISLYRYDGEKCIATIDGMPTAFVTRANMVDITEAVNEIIL